MKAKVISIVSILLFFVFLYLVYLLNFMEIYGVAQEIGGWAIFGGVMSIWLTLGGLTFLLYRCIGWVLKD